MINKEFEAYKLKKQIKKCGENFLFFRLGENDFGEPNQTPSEVGSISGLYHEKNEHISVMTGDTTSYRTEKVPSILCLYDDVKSLGLKKDDYIILNGKKNQVTGIVNIQEWNIISDISLEVVDDGSD